MDKEAAEMFFKIFSHNEDSSNSSLFFAFGNLQVVDGLVHYFLRNENLKKFSCSPLIFYFSKEWISDNVGSLFSDIFPIDEARELERILSTDANDILDKFKILFDLNNENIIPIGSNLDNIIRKITNLSFSGGAFFLTPNMQEKSMQFFCELYKILSVEILKIYSNKAEKK